MKNSYMNLGIVYLQSFGERVMGINNHILLFDNLLGTEPEPDITFPFKTSLMKLDFNIVVICVDGELGYNIDFKKVDMHTRDIVFIKKGQITEFCSFSPDCRVILIAMSSELIAEIEQSIPSLRNPELPGDGRRFALPAGMFEEMMQIYGLMRKKLGDMDFRFRYEVIRNYAGIVLSDFMHLSQTSETAESDIKTAPHYGRRQGELYRSFIKMVKENFKKERSVGFYADCMCVTPNYLSRVVRRVSGRSAGEWIKDYVILEAKALLGAGNMPVSSISESLNFANPSFFSKYFRENTGMSPSAYQKRH